VEKQLIAWGAGAGESGGEYLPAPAALQLAGDHGRIRLLRQWYLGFRALLDAWGSLLDGFPGVVALNSPAAIALMFDKVACQGRLREGGVAVPRSLPGITGYAALRERLAGGAGRVFVKPAHGSSASGVVAYRAGRGREEAITSVELVREGGEVKLYNSLKVRRYAEARDIAFMLDYILGEGAIVEEWIPKAALGGLTFDVRVVVVGGQARHVLPRLGPGPLTNLHLGNRRGEAAALAQLLGPERYAQLLRTATAAVRAIPGTFYAGVDLLIPAGLGTPRVLEVNAFGDLLPNLLHAGEDTYTAELTTFFRSRAPIH
jgi:glutathione synthase/RimK-type ligase-like ATP-grasp enzyme